MIKAPWTQAQVDALNEYQKSGRFHGYTCGGNHGASQLLVATIYGWVCPIATCSYSQNWAHALSMSEDAYTETIKRDKIQL